MNFTRVLLLLALICNVLACTHYTVRNGDTLSGIASRYGTTYIKIANENNIKAPYTIYPGQVLNINCKGNPTPPTPPKPTPPSPSGKYYPVSASQLLKICPNMGSTKANNYLPYLHQAMIDASITTRRRAIDFIAQLAQESGEFRYMEEIASGAAYEGRKDLCNTHKGDGKKYKGRGPIQVTGRCNYTQAQKDTGFNLVDNPYQASEPKIGFRLSAWYWNHRNLNRYCDNNDFVGLTKAINGGTNGLSGRKMYRARGESAL